MRITLRQLQVFDAVATHGSVTDAATVLCMSQSAASAALRDLQGALDRPPLLHRDGRKLQVTPEGKKLRPLVRAMLDQAREIECGDPEISGTVTVGASETGNETLPRVAVSFRRRFPDVKVEIQTGPTREMIERLSNMQIEMLVTDSMTRAPGAILRECYHERSILVAAPDHPLAHKRKLDFDDLANAEWCMPARNSLTNMRLLDALRGRLANFRVVMEVNSNEGLREAIKAGGGIGCLPEGLLRLDLEAGRLVELVVPGFTIRRPTYLVRLRNVRPSPVADAFADHLLRSAHSFPSNEEPASLY